MASNDSNDGNGRDDNKRKDPWSNRGDAQSPPDLDEIFRKFHRKLSGKLRGGDSGDGGEPAGDSDKSGIFGLVSIGLIIILIWAAFGFFIVGQPERAVVLRFGKYIETVGPGAHWIPPFIESKYKVNEQHIISYQYNDKMFTKDENIVSVAVVVQYRVAEAKDFRFNTTEPVQSLKEATASALRQVVGNNTLDFVITTGRETIRTQIQQQLVETLSRYKTGLLVTDVKLQSATAPDEVKEAFDDVTKAREDKQRFINEAQAYALQVSFNAKGKAKRLLADANAYKEQVVLHAKGETARYLAILPVYQQSPEVTRERMYIGALEGVFNRTTKVLVDVKGSNNLLYLPLDQLMAGKLSQLANQAQVTPPLAATSTSTQSSSGQYSAATNNTGYFGSHKANPYAFNSQQGGQS